MMNIVIVLMPEGHFRWWCGPNILRGTIEDRREEPAIDPWIIGGIVIIFFFAASSQVRGDGCRINPC